LPLSEKFGIILQYEIYKKLFNVYILSNLPDFASLFLLKNQIKIKNRIIP